MLENPLSTVPTSSFVSLIESRRKWIEDVLKPWCRTATRAELLMAEQNWLDLAGRPDAEKTLWQWAWGRFPVLTAEGLGAINETSQVTVRTKLGEAYSGYPDARETKRGELILVSTDGTTLPSISIDQISSIEATNVR